MIRIYFRNPDDTTSHTIIFQREDIMMGVGALLGHVLKRPPSEWPENWGYFVPECGEDLVFRLTTNYCDIGSVERVLPEGVRSMRFHFEHIVEGDVFT